MDISVIIPVYNGENFLSHCVASLVSAQQRTHLAIELILVDDGSQDASGLLCDSYAQKYDFIRSIRQENQGVSVARNTGIEAALGKYIIFVDVDDYVEEDIFVFMESHLPDNKTFMVYSVYLKAGTRRTAPHIDSQKVATPDFLRQATVGIGVELVLCSPFNKLFLTSIIKLHNIRFLPWLKVGEDFVFNMQYLRYTPNMIIYDVPLYNYDTAVTTSAIKRFYREYDRYIYTMHREAEQTFRYYNVAKENIVFLNNFFCNRWAYALLCCLSSELDVTAQAKIISIWMNNLSPVVKKMLSTHQSPLRFFAQCQTVTRGTIFHYKLYCKLDRTIKRARHIITKYTKNFAAILS